ncbi:hypothetical protein F2P79_001072 [Pimephales promelas]|nr:hypothetical protein F2P79_001072 [Pimephales promelas]
MPEVPSNQVCEPTIISMPVGVELDEEEWLIERITTVLSLSPPFLSIPKSVPAPNLPLLFAPPKQGIPSALSQLDFFSPFGSAKQPGLALELSITSSALGFSDSTLRLVPLRLVPPRTVDLSAPKGSLVPPAAHWSVFTPPTPRTPGLSAALHPSTASLRLHQGPHSHCLKLRQRATSRSGSNYHIGSSLHHCRLLGQSEISSTVRTSLDPINAISSTRPTINSSMASPAVFSTLNFNEGIGAIDGGFTAAEEDPSTTKARGRFLFDQQSFTRQPLNYSSAEIEKRPLSSCELGSAPCLLSVGPQAEEV